MAYPSEAVTKCERLYARGLTHSEIEARMQKDYPDWSRKNLYGENGWIEKYNFNDARARYQNGVKQFEQEAENTANEMLGELVKLRKDLYNDMTMNGATADPQKIYAYTRLTTSIERLLRSDDEVQAGAIDIEHNELFGLLMQIPDIRNAIDKNKKEVLEKIERL